MKVKNIKVFLFILCICVMMQQQDHSQTPPSKLDYMAKVTQSSYHPLEFSVQIYYKPALNSTLFITLEPTDVEPGIKVTILRHWPCQTPLPTEFQIHAKVVDQLFGDPNELRNVVFLQIVPPTGSSSSGSSGSSGSNPQGNLTTKFVPYDREKEKFPLTMSAFLTLMKTFAKSEFKQWETRLEDIQKNMVNGIEKFPINSTMSFSGMGDIYLVATIKEKSHYSLLLEIMWKHLDVEKRSLILTYTKIKDIQHMNLDPVAMGRLAREHDNLLVALGYKEERGRKRSRQ